MARLHPVLPIHGDETHRSWAARLAAFHIGAPVTELFADMNIDPFAYALGAADEVERLAEIAGVSLHEMHSATLKRVNRRVFRLGDEVLISAVHGDEDLRFCPACLREDAETAALLRQPVAVHLRERLIWRFRAVRRCPRHDIPLGCIDRPDEEELIGVFPTQLVAAVDTPVSCAQTDSLEAYIARRLAGAAGQKWLDALPLAQAIQSAELLGTALEFEPYDVFEDLTDLERETAIRCGWDFISQGRRGLRRALGILNEKSWRPPGCDKWQERCVFAALVREAAAPD